LFCFFSFLFSSSLHFSPSFWVISFLCAFVVFFVPVVWAGQGSWLLVSWLLFLGFSSLPWVWLLFSGSGFSSVASLFWWMAGGGVFWLLSFLGGWRMAVGWLLGFRNGWRIDGGGLASLSHGGGGLASRQRRRAVVFVGSPPLGAASGGMVCVLWARRMMERCVFSVAALFFLFNDHSSCGAALGPSPGGLCGVS
jgi:hypothetical protein